MFIVEDKYVSCILFTLTLSVCLHVENRYFYLMLRIPNRVTITILIRKKKHHMHIFILSALSLILFFCKSSLNIGSFYQTIKYLHPTSTYI